MDHSFKLEDHSRIDRRTLLQSMGALALGGTFFAACGGGDGDAGSSGTSASGVISEGSPKRGGVARIAITSGSTKGSLDPATWDDQMEQTVLGSMYESLVDVDEQTWKPKPMLAESWDVNRNGTEWVFNLRSGIEFHDGRPLTAEDAAYSLRRLLDEKLGSPLYGRLSSNLDASGIKAQDKQTLRLTLKRPDAFLLNALAYQWAAVVPDGTTDFGKGIGTGPFKLKSFNPGQSFESERNPEYWQDGRPYLDGIRGVVMNELAAKVEAINAGQLELTDALSPSALRLLKGKDLQTVNLKSSSFQELEMRMTSAPFDDAKVRAAIKLAQDRKRILDVALHGQGELTADVPAPVSDPFFPEGLTPSAQDVDGAKRLLSEAGFGSGLDLTLLTSDAAPNMADVAVVFAESVKDAGIRVKVEQRPSATYWDQVWLTKPFATVWTGRRHPFEAMSLLLRSGGAWNGVQYDDPKFDGLLADAQKTTDDSEQKRYLGEALARASSTSGFVLAALSDGLYAAAPKVRSFQPTYRWLNGRLTDTWLA